MAPQTTPLIIKLTQSTQIPIFNIVVVSVFLSLFYLFCSFNSTTTTKTASRDTINSPNLKLTHKTKHSVSNNGETEEKTEHFVSNNGKTEGKTEQSVSSNGETEERTEHSVSNNGVFLSPPKNQLQPIKACPKNFTNYCPCQDLTRIKRISRVRFFNRERHCPEEGEKVRCLVPAPVRYRNPFRWPKSKDMAWYNNVPFKRLTVDKKLQNWVRLEGDRFVFPGGGTSFRHGVKGYVDLIEQVLDLRSGVIRTVLDVGCGVATFGAALLDLNILTMSTAPVDLHEAQVQFALERGVPAMLGILSTYRLPYPSRSFDLAHCARCLVKWTHYDGLYLMEVDRVLRPGGYFVLSGPPIKWRDMHRGWNRSAEDLEKEQMDLEALARRMCWKKIAENGPIAVWQKPTNHVHCSQKLRTWKSLHFCDDNDSDFAWYKNMEPCVTPLPDVKDIKVTSGGTLEKWPRRLHVPPPRITTSSSSGAITARTFNEDNLLWKRRVQQYGDVLDSLSKGRYRNVMDMNAGLGGFAAALSAYPVWVMNVVPFDAENNTLGVIYERGLIGTYMNWCEAFSTYPRTYDLVHADGVFSMYMNKCDILDILLEMYRVLRPHGAVIVRDHVDIVVKVKELMEKMGWNGRISQSESGSSYPEKVMFVDNSKK